MFNTQEKGLWFLTWMAVVITVAITAWWVVPNEWPDESGSSGPEAIATTPTGNFSELRARTVETDKLIENLASLSERVQMLTDSVTYLEDKLIRAHVLTDSIISIENKIASTIPQDQKAGSGIEPIHAAHPPTAAGITDTDKTHKTSTLEPDGVALEKPAVITRNTDTVSAGSTNTNKPVSVAKREPAKVKHQNPVSGDQHPTHTDKMSSWIINLVSMRKKSDADEFTARARSRNIHTEQEKASVKGKMYWRVQITGFSTLDEAKSQASIAKEKLGLKDVWITKR